MLLRLFFAQAEKPDCPWLGMAASVSFVEFKEKISAARESGFDCDAVALVFLGGTDPSADIGLEADEFEVVDPGARSHKELFLRQVQHLFAAARAVIGGDEMISDRQ
jgi:hypothetical protein